MERLRQAAFADDDEQQGHRWQTEGHSEPLVNGAGRTADVDGIVKPAVEDDAIAEVDAYMARLLARIEGTAAPADRDADRRQQVAAGLDPNGRQGSERSRRAAPEQAADIAAMRELANTSSRMAIEKSRRSRMVSSAVGKFLVAGLSLLIGLAILYLSVGSSFLGEFGAFIAIVAAVLWVFQAMLIWKAVAIRWESMPRTNASRRLR